MVVMVTIFTPVYNRKYIIRQLYDSLKSQTNKNFEWIVIDDGSTDGVFDLLQSWEKSETSFTIKSYRVENGGKHRAINRAVRRACGEAFFIVDSDDFISDDAVEFIEKHFPEVRGDGFAGIAGLKYSIKSKKNVGQTVLFDTFVDATNLERDLYGLQGDKAEVYKTAVLLKYPFPEYAGENFITEAVVWNHIARDGFKIRWYNKPIYYCDYLDDGLTHQGLKLFERNPFGWAKWVSDSDKYGYFQKSVIQRNSLSFYISNMDKSCFNEIKKKFFVGIKSFSDAEKLIDDAISSLKKYIPDNDIKKIAVYGNGLGGKFVQKILELVDLRCLYVIDKKSFLFNEPDVVSLSDKLPKVDLVILTMKNVTLDKDELTILNGITKKIITINELVKDFP